MLSKYLQVVKYETVPSLSSLSSSEWSMAVYCVSGRKFLRGYWVTLPGILFSTGLEPSMLRYRR